MFTFFCGYTAYLQAIAFLLVVVKYMLQILLTYFKNNNILLVWK